MPKTSSSKKSKKRTLEPVFSKQIAADISEAVEKIPDMVRRHLRSSPVNLYAPQPSALNREIQRKKQRLLWIGVLSLAVVILAMWAWNAKILLYAMNYREKNPSLLETAREDFYDAVRTVNEHNQFQEIISKNDDDRRKSNKKNDAILDNSLSLITAALRSQTASSTESASTTNAVSEPDSL